MLLAPAIQIDGRALEGAELAALVHARVDLALGLAGRATLRFQDFGASMASSRRFRIGAPIRISAGTSVLMTGEVTAVALEQGVDRAPLFTITVDDRGCRLASTTQTRTFLNQSIAEVVAKIANEIGASSDYDGPRDIQEYQLQAGSNLELLNILCARAGLVWWISTGTTSRLMVREAGTTSGQVSVTLGADEGLDRFTVRATDAGPESVTVRGWDRARVDAVEGKADRARPAESPFVAGATGRRRSGRGPQRLLVTQPTPLTAAEAARTAAGRLTESATAAVVARGEGVVNPRIALGCAVQVKDAGPASGTYAVSRVEHVYDRAGFRTGFTAGPVRPAGLVDLLGPGPALPGLTIQGVLPAIVTNVTDEAGLGRVKVKYATLSDRVESAWARLVTLGAGKDRGLVLHPEVNDEVLIAFEHGDTRRPVVLGGLFSSTNPSPAKDGVAGNKVRFRRITSRLGHVVELADGDAPADQHVLLELGGKKNRIRLGADRLDVVTDRTAIRIDNGVAKIELSQAGDLRIAAKSIQIEASNDVTIKANAKVGVKGVAGVAVQGAQVQVKADATGSVEAGGPLVIKGATVAIN